MLRLAAALNIAVRQAPIPCRVAAEPGAVCVADLSDEDALAEGIALALLASGGAPHTIADARELARRLRGP
jgi:hypothetical protein